MQVDFIICGTQKGGTSTLDAYLREHPQICMANQKELHFFDNETIFCHKQQSDYTVYHAAFNVRPIHQLLGEATPIYMYWYDAPRQIWEYNAALKLIVILRNPITRAYSHWNMERARGADNLSFWDAIHQEPARCREALPYQHRIYSYIDRGFYVAQLRRLWTYFPTEQVLILRSEELKEQPQATLQKICDFLHIDPFLHIAAQEIHALPYISPMNEREQEYLHDIFEYEIRSIERILGWDCGDWLK